MEPYSTRLTLVKPENEARLIARQQIQQLEKFAAVLLDATGGASEAESMLDDVVDLLVEGGVLCTWRYRLLLMMIRGEV